MEADEVIYGIAMVLMIASVICASLINDIGVWIGLLLMTMSSFIKGLLWQKEYYRSLI